MGAELKSFSALLVETWELYKKRAIIILAVFLLSTLVVLALITLLGIGAALIIGVNQATLTNLENLPVNAVSLGTMGFFFLFSMVAAMWSQSAMIAVVVDHTLGIGGAFREGWQRIWSMGWILLLAGSIVIIGFLLFVLPGIIFSVSLMFALYPLYDEDLRGMDAVMASRAYVRGRWWSTFGRLVLVWLLAIAISLIPVVGQLLYFIFTPFLLLFMVVLYRNLKETSRVDPTTEKRGVWWLLALMGMALPVLGVVGALLGGGTQFKLALDQSIREMAPVPQQLPQSTTPSPKKSASQAPVESQPAETEAGDIWRDPTGDVVQFGVGQWMDIETVSVHAATTMLEIELQTREPLGAALNAASTTAQSFHTLATLYFDSDVNRATGGSVGKDNARSGYDFGIDIIVEAPRNHPENGQIHASLFSFTNGARRFLGPLPENDLTYGDNLIKMRIPFTMIGARPGQQLRMSYLETYQEQGNGLSKDKLINL